jgi:flagellar biosynthesis/type III secretory pathway protein FliH
MTWSSDWSQPAGRPEPGAPGGDPWNLRELHASTLDARLTDDTLGISPDEEERIQRQAELEEAFAQGYEQGVEDALLRDGERIEQAMLALADAVETVHGAAHAWTRSAKEHVLALAIAVARQVIDRELKGDAHAVADLVRRALAQFPIDEAVSIRVHPQDLSTISTAAGPAGTGIRIAPGRSVQWVADPDLATGGCVVEGRLRIVDGRVDLALERIYRKLLDD